MTSRLAASLFPLLLAGLPASGQQQRLDLTNFVVLGDGLAAGYAGFSLQRVNQERSFPALLAKQMNVANFPQPLIQAPGLGNLAGFPALPARIPGTLQNTVRVPGGSKPDRPNGQPPIALFVFNVSLPGMRIEDVIHRRPVAPLIQPNDPQQTLINMTIGFPGMVVGQNKPVWSQLEYARQMNPSAVLVSLGYYDFVDAVGKADPSLLPDVAAFRENFRLVLSTLRTLPIPLIVATVPNPLDTAFVSSLAAASQALVAPPATLAGLYRLREGDLITIPGLMTVGSQLLAERPGDLPSNGIIRAEMAEEVRRRVQAINAEIANLTREHGGVLYDMHALFSRVRANGLVAGGRSLTADFQGGIYSLSGFYPGATLHAVIANELVGVVNNSFGLSFQTADLNAIIQDDPAARILPALRQPDRVREELQ